MILKIKRNWIVIVGFQVIACLLETKNQAIFAKKNQTIFHKNQAIFDKLHTINDKKIMRFLIKKTKRFLI